MASKTARRATRQRNARAHRRTRDLGREKPARIAPARADIDPGDEMSSWLVPQQLPWMQP